MAGFLVSAVDVLRKVSVQQDGTTPEELVEHGWLVNAYPHLSESIRRRSVAGGAEEWIASLIKSGYLVQVVPGYYRTSYTSPTIGEVRQLREKVGTKA